MKAKHNRATTRRWRGDPSPLLHFSDFTPNNMGYMPRQSRKRQGAGRRHSRIAFATALFRIIPLNNRKAKRVGERCKRETFVFIIARLFPVQEYSQIQEA